MSSINIKNNVAVAVFCLFSSPLPAQQAEQTKESFKFTESDWTQRPGHYLGSFQCTTHDKERNKTVRYIIVDYPSGAELPCRVIYYKPREDGSRDILWRSLNTVGFCSEKAGGLADKLQSFGWECMTAAGDMRSAETEEEDVTRFASEDLPVKAEIPSIEGFDPFSSLQQQEPQTGQPNEDQQAAAEETLDVNADEEAVLDFVGPKIELQLDQGVAHQGKSYDFSALVTDNIAVKAVHFFYQSAGADYVSLPMKRGEDSDLYSVTLPSEVTSVSEINYYVTAEDISYNAVFRGNVISPLTLQFNEVKVQEEVKAVEHIEPETEIQEVKSVEPQPSNEEEGALW